MTEDELTQGIEVDKTFSSVVENFLLKIKELEIQKVALNNEINDCRRRVAELCKNYRISRGATAAAIARELKYTHAYISDLESSRRPFYESLIIRYLHACEKHKTQ